MNLEEALEASVTEDVVTINDSTIVVNNDLRTMSIPEKVSILGVESDESVNRLKFRLPRYYCDLDLGEFNIYVNYLNGRTEDIYVVTDKKTTSEYVEFSWLVGRNAFKNKGYTKFVLCLKKSGSDGTVIKEFNTTVHKLEVLEGLETEVDTSSITQNTDLNDLIDQIKIMIDLEGKKVISNLPKDYQELINEVKALKDETSQLKNTTVNLENLYAKENLVSLELTGQTGFATKTGDIQRSYYRKVCNIEGGKKYYIFTQFDPSQYHPQLVLLNKSNEVLSTYQDQKNTYIGIELNVQNDCVKIIINCNDENTPVLCLKMNKYEYNGTNIKNELADIVEMRYVQVEPCCKVMGLVNKNGKLSKNTEFVQNVFSVTGNEKYKLKTYCGNTFMDYVIYDKNYNVLSSSSTSVKNFEYRNYDITIPEKAKIMMVCGNKNNAAIIECCKEIRLSVDKDETVLAIQNENEVFRKKIADEQLKNDFAFSQDLIQVATFSFDDSNADIDKIEDLFEQKGVPCCFATIPKKLDEKCSNGESVREVLKRCEENGGEVLAHWQTPLTSESTDEDYYNVYVGAWKTLTQAGFMVNGIITAGGTNYQTQNFDKCIEIARPYYAYGDMTAYISDNRRPDQYINMRKFISKNTDNDIQNYIDKFINNGEHSYFARWLNFASHGESDGTTIPILSDIIDYLKEKNIPIVTWNYVFTHYNSSLLEKRIKALESS